MGSKVKSRIIKGTDYYKYHPATVKLSSEGKDWDGLTFTHYLHPKHFRGAPRPATSDHILAFGCGGAVKGENSINSDKWRPYVWREEEWLMGPAFGNDRDSCWDTLCDEDQDLNVCYLHLSPKVIKDAALQMGICAPENFELPIKMGFKDPLMYQLGLQIKKEVEQNNPFGRVYIETAKNMLAVHLLTNYCGKSLVQPSDKTPIKRRLNAFSNVIDYIQSNLNKDLSLKALSFQANMSEFHFAHAFKEAMGVAPHQYVVDERMKKARCLLKSTCLSVEIIAGDLGYSSSYFVQLFKRYTGATPAAYRKQSR